MEKEINNSKKSIGKNILKAIGYFMLYFIITQIVSVVYTIIYMMNLGLDTILSIAEDSADMMMLIQEIAQSLLTQSTMIMLISGILILLTLFIIFKVRKKDIKETLSIKKIEKKAILPIILIGLGLNIITSVIISLIPNELTAEYNQNVNSVFLGNIIVNFITVVFIAPILEEVIFRGLVFKKFKEAIHIVPAIILSSLLFAIMHGQIIWIIYAFVLGVILTLVFIKFKSILANIILHMSYNLLPFILLIFSAHTENISIGIILGAIVLVILSFVYLKKLNSEQIETEKNIVE